MQQFIFQAAAGREDPSCGEMKLLDGGILDKKGGGVQGRGGERWIRDKFKKKKNLL